MKKFIKNHYLILIILSILLTIIISSCVEVIRSEIRNDRNLDIQIQECREGKKNLDVPGYKEYCENLLSKPKYKVDFYSMLTDRLAFLSYLSFTAILFLLIPSLLHLSKSFKNRIPLNELTRENYRTFLKKTFKKMYQYVWLFPLVAFVLLAICFFFTLNISAKDAVENSLAMWRESTMQHFVFFVLCYILNIFLHSCLYLNIGLIVLRRQHNYFLALLMSFLLFIGLEAFLEIFVNGILFGILFHIPYSLLFNISNMMRFYDGAGVLPLLLINVFWVVLSGVIVYYSYRNQESFIMSLEKEVKHD